MDKFKDQEALQKAYESLEKEFTRRSQRLRELQGKEEKEKADLKTVYKQAVKDTAKEIYELLEKWAWKLKNEKGGLGKFRFAVETVMQEIKEKYLLEVANFKLVELKKGGRK